MSRIPLATAVAAARATHAGEIDAIVARGEALGHPADPDVLALILQAHTEHPRHRDRGWDRAGFYFFFWADLFNWCSLAGCEVPEHLPEALWLWLHHLDATGGLGPADEPLHELLKVLFCYGGLGFDGRPLPEGAPRQVVCECREAATAGASQHG